MSQASQYVAFGPNVVPIGSGSIVAGQSFVTALNGLNSNLGTFGLTTAVVSGPSAAYSLGGVAQAGNAVPANGQVIDIVNATAQIMTVVNQDASSLAQNRIKIASGSNAYVPPNAILRLVGSGGQWLLQDTGVIYRSVFHVAEYGARGDSIQDDTTFIQSAISAASAIGGGLIYIPATSAYHKITSALTLATNCTLHVDGHVQQTVTGQHLLTATGLSNVKIRGNGQLTGVGGSAYTSTEQAIYLISCSHVTIDSGLAINTFKGHGVYLQGCTDVSLGAFLTYNVAGGIRFTGCSRVTAVGTILRDTSTPAGTFTGGFFLDSTDGQTYGYCTDMQFIGCKVSNYPTAQSFEIHAGERISMIGCEVIGGLVGYSANPYVPGAGQYCTTQASFTQPAVGSTVTVQVDNSAASGFVVGMTVWLPSGGVYILNAIPDATHITLQNTGHELNAAATSTVPTTQRVMPGDVTQDITWTGCTYSGTSTSQGALSYVQFGFYAAGDSQNPVRNLKIVGGTVTQGGATMQNSANIIGGGIYLGPAIGVQLVGTTFDYCYQAGIYLAAGVREFYASDFRISNVVSAGGRQTGVWCTVTDSTGHIRDFVVDTANSAVRFENLGTTSIPVDRFEAFNVSVRGENVVYGIIDGILYKPVNATTVTLNPYVHTVVCQDSSSTTVTQPMGSALDKQEVTYLATTANTIINQANADLDGGVLWTSATSNSLRLKYHSTAAAAVEVSRAANSHVAITTGSTVSVQGGIRNVLLNGSNTQVLTDMTGGVIYQIVTIWLSVSGQTVSRAGSAGTGFVLAGGANAVASSGNAVLVVMYNGNYWMEISRSLNDS